MSTAPHGIFHTKESGQPGLENVNKGKQSEHDEDCMNLSVLNASVNSTYNVERVNIELHERIDLSEPSMLTIENGSVTSPEDADPRPPKDKRATSASPGQAQLFPPSGAPRPSPLPNGKTPRCSARRCCLCAGPVGVVIAVSAAIALGVACSYFLSSGVTSGMTLQLAALEMRINDSYHDDMADINSVQSRAYASMLCYNVLETVQSSLSGVSCVSCDVTSLRRGSIIANVTLVFSATNEKAENIANLLNVPRRGTEDPTFLHLGELTVFADSLRVWSLLHNVNATDDPLPNGFHKDHWQTTEFDCLKPGRNYRPYPYTFPGFCGTHQLCQNGKSIRQKCYPGLEFSLDPEGSELSPCRPPSDQTYCGKKRVGLESTSRTTAPSNTATPTQEFLNCSNVDERIWEDLPSLYTCPANGIARVPSRTTYPANCSSFVWCVGGRQYDYSCAKGTDFSLTAEQCIWSQSSSSFCQQQSLARQCKEEEFLPSPLISTTVPPGEGTTLQDVATLPRNCSVSLSNVLPAEDTYPHHCGHFLQCVEGASVPKTCPADLHFAPSHEVCVMPTSTLSYCSLIQEVDTGS